MHSQAIFSSSLPANTQATVGRNTSSLRAPKKIKHHEEPSFHQNLASVTWEIKSWSTTATKMFRRSGIGEQYPSAKRWCRPQTKAELLRTSIAAKPFPDVPLGQEVFVYQVWELFYSLSCTVRSLFEILLTCHVIFLGEHYSRKELTELSIYNLLLDSIEWNWWIISLECCYPT